MSIDRKAVRPIERAPTATWKHRTVFDGIRNALGALPTHFESETNIVGVAATDIQTLSQMLGAAIEQQVVRTLNGMRSLWDPNGQCASFSFVRQAQTFPDVLLQSTDAREIVMGIELKGWYLLAKERTPSFRYTVTPDACADADLLVVVPWALEHIVSGRPIVFNPFVISARFAAEMRNYHWQSEREAKSDSGIDSPQGVRPYPKKSDQISDQPREDKGGNFGRIASSGVLNEYRDAMLAMPLSGIPVRYWCDFFSVFQERADEQQIRSALERLRSKADRLIADRSERSEALQMVISGIEHLIGT